MLKTSYRFFGPFSQLISLSNLPLKGKLEEDNLEIISHAGILVCDGKIKKTGPFDSLQVEAKKLGAQTVVIPSEMVVLPGFVDAHTHICYAGTRANDYALRISGKSYLDIAKAGGGIWQTVTDTRNASTEDLVSLLTQRSALMLQRGVTTTEVKSGYGLNLNDELKMLRAIRDVNQNTTCELISTCLAAHIKPKDFEGTPREYLDYLLENVLPVVRSEKLSNRVDIFTEASAFDVHDSAYFLQKAKAMGFELTVHADQFSTGGSKLAVSLGAQSADHLEASKDREIKTLASSQTVATVLPGASLGLGINFAPARKMLDAGCCLAIASDWNPGSAPMGCLLTQASLLGAYEKLNAAEIFAGITYRAAKALGLADRGKIEPGLQADFIGFPCSDYREILYHQGQMQPSFVCKKGRVEKQ
ncbi:MAG: imidazolonepropionase [Bacteroidetes bacterium]|nr:imidazolonepropionase [Bacteroidota bacterium]